jgi:periplasmic protein TonB
MNATRAGTWLLSCIAHAALVWLLIVKATGVSHDAGAGRDEFKIEQGVSIESVVAFGDAAATTAEAVDAQAVQPVAATEPIVAAKEMKDEIPPVIASTAHISEETATTNEVQPHEEKPSEPTPQVAEVEPRMASTAEVEQVQAASSGQFGGTVTILTEYYGLASRALERHKVNPHSRIAGVVVVRFSLEPSGRVVSREVQTSSGSKVLDDAAIATLDRSSPLPPVPQELVDAGQLTFAVPFKFRIR